MTYKSSKQNNFFLWWGIATEWSRDHNRKLLFICLFASDFWHPRFVFVKSSFLYVKEKVKHIKVIKNNNKKNEKVIEQNETDYYAKHCNPSQHFIHFNLKQHNILFFVFKMCTSSIGIRKTLRGYLRYTNKTVDMLHSRLIIRLSFLSFLQYKDEHKHFTKKDSHAIWGRQFQLT